MDSPFYVKYLLQNRFASFISLFGLSAILKIRNGEHAHYVGLVVAYTWSREKQMFVALGKEFDMSTKTGPSSELGTYETVGQYFQNSICKCNKFSGCGQPKKLYG